MANLLPEKEARAMKGEFRDRFVMATALVLLATAGIAALMLFPSYQILASTESGDQSAIQKAREDKQDQQEMMRVQTLNKDVNAVLAATSSPTLAISRVMALRPKGIDITDISYSPGSGANLIISGSGSNRDVINDYHDALLKDPHFTTVSIPVSVLVGAEEGGGFSATISTSY